MAEETARRDDATTQAQPASMGMASDAGNIARSPDHLPIPGSPTPNPVPIADSDGAAGDGSADIPSANGVRAQSANGAATPTFGSNDQTETFRAAKQEISRRYLSSNRTTGFHAFGATSPAPNLNVVGVAVGEKIAEGKATGVLAIKFLVRIKYPSTQISSDQRLPDTVGDLPTDVEQVGDLRRFTGPQSPNPRARIRPAHPGSSVGFGSTVMAGTFGALVTKNNNLYILSNNHVLANENRLPAGSPIYQPGLLDGGDMKTDQIAGFTEAIPLDPNISNRVDCALAKVSDPSSVTNSIFQIGVPQGIIPATRDMIVHKFGRTTNYTAGRIISVDADVTISYDTGEYTFEEQILIAGLGATPFSASGDSGSLILERSSWQAIGLLFAGSTSHTIANPIEDVLTMLNVTFA